MIGSYSENGRYFVFAGNLTYCTPDTIVDTIIRLHSGIENHPDDKYCTQVYPEFRRGEYCTFESAQAEFEAYRDYKVLRAKTYRECNS